MIRSLVVLTLLLCLAPPALALHGKHVLRDWSEADIALESAYLFVLYQDWQQTRRFTEYSTCKEITERHGTCELNPLLGNYPSPERVNLLIGSAAIGHILVADWLSPKHRQTWILAWTAIESFVVARSVQLGWNLRF